MPLAPRNGITLHEQALGSGPPVVMLHGLLVGNLATWYWTAAPVLAQTKSVLLYDLRGHGLSEKAPTGYDPRTMAADLGAVLDAFSPREPVALVGHSYGAVIALTYALAHPDRVARLAVVEAPLPPSRLEELDAFLEKTPDEMLGALPSALRDALASGGRRGRRFVEAMRFLAQESSLFADVRRAEDIPDAVLATLRPPLLAVYGTESSCRPVGQRLARVVPRARLVEIEGGHFLPLERPANVTTALTEFLDG